MTTMSDTADYDPRYERAQTIQGAKARFISEEHAYTLTELEDDVERILEQGEFPDRGRDGPILGSQVVY